MKNYFFILVVIFSAVCIQGRAQVPVIDSAAVSGHPVPSFVDSGSVQYYHLSNGETLVYARPKSFSFITHLPKDFAGIGKSAFSKNSINAWLLIGYSTAFLMIADESINTGVRRFSDNMNMEWEQQYKNLVTFKLGEDEVKVLRAPQNVNTALYQLGQGFPGLLIGAGLFTYGKIKKDYRSLNTASQLAEAFILMGVSTQVIKRITGRQTPGEATVRGGEWNFFPSFREYQQNTPYYDAFPSGHLATMMSTVTILAMNYPEKRWIRPLGYSLIGLVGAAMVNNRVHWASDYPLAIGLGYLCAKQVVRNNRKVIPGASGVATKPRRGQWDYSLSYINGSIQPGLRYIF